MTIMIMNSLYHFPTSILSTTHIYIIRLPSIYLYRCRWSCVVVIQSSYKSIYGFKICIAHKSTSSHHRADKLSFQSSEWDRAKIFKWIINPVSLFLYPLISLLHRHHKNIYPPSISNGWWLNASGVSIEEKVGFLCVRSYWIQVSEYTQTEWFPPQWVRQWWRIASVAADKGSHVLEIITRRWASTVTITPPPSPVARDWMAWLSERASEPVCWAWAVDSIHSLGGGGT